MGKAGVAAWAGFDLSTTGLGLGVRGRDGGEDYVHLKIRGATAWHNQPAFDLQTMPGMISDLLDRLEDRGWSLERTFFSFAVRQHDMVLLDDRGRLLTPALSWQCTAASRQVARLRRLGAEAIVGRVEERFILPKLMWALEEQPGLGEALAQVMTTGDWIAAILTGKARLSTSDALSNGLLVQETKLPATEVMVQAGLNPEWFPPVIQSGELLGPVDTRVFPGMDEAWTAVKERLAGSRLVSGLGDNHATGVGCGLTENDFETIVVSAGTSGTVNRICPARVPLAGNAVCFEFYDNRLLFMMLADCCKWYDRFVERFAGDYSDGLDRLNALIDETDLDGLGRVRHENGEEFYPADWDESSLGRKTAATQLSIMLELLLRTRRMLVEVRDPGFSVSRYILTGGLSQSLFFQQAFRAGIRLIDPEAEVLISARKGPLRYQTAAYGALLNAMRPEDGRTARKLALTQDAAEPSSALTNVLRSWMADSP